MLGFAGLQITTIIDGVLAFWPSLVCFLVAVGRHLKSEAKLCTFLGPVCHPILPKGCPEGISGTSSVDQKGAPN